MATLPADQKHAGYQDIILLTAEAREEQYGGMVAVAIMLIAAMVFAVGLAAGAGLFALLAH